MECNNKCYHDNFVSFIKKANNTPISTVEIIPFVLAEEELQPHFAADNFNCRFTSRSSNDPAMKFSFTKLRILKNIFKYLEETLILNLLVDRNNSTLATLLLHTHHRLSRLSLDNQSCTRLLQKLYSQNSC